MHKMQLPTMTSFLFATLICASNYGAMGAREWHQLEATELSRRVTNSVWASAESSERPTTASAASSSAAAVGANLKQIQLDLPAISGRLEPNKLAIKALRAILTDADGKNQKYFDYAPTAGLLETREAIKEHFGARDASDVFLTSGASHALQLAIQAIANPGENILVPMPGWEYYRVLARVTGVGAKEYRIRFERDRQSEVDLASLEAQIDAGTRAILFNNPTNPHGVVFPAEQIEAVLRIAEKHKLPIIADETFRGMVFNPAVHFHSMVSLRPRVPIITCDGIGKRYLLPGWRLGWLIVHDHAGVLAQVKKGLMALCQLINGPATILQAAVPQILAKTGQRMFDATNRALAKNAALFHARLGELPGFRPFMPQAGWFIVVQIDPTLYRIDVETFVKKLKREKNVHLLSGSIFGITNWVRIALVVSEQTILEACKRIGELSREYYAPIVTINQQGKVQGFTTLAGTVEVFKGIPYAKPPIGELRFEKPQPADPWDGVLPAMEHKKSCYLHANPDWLTVLLYDQGDPSEQTENCLYLNVFTKSGRKPNDPLMPVLVIIHGGGFEMGSSTQYSIEEDIGATFVHHGIVVVNMQYRLGQLGFASTGDEDMPGNFGLWDQNAALHWVRENIGYFGGDRAQITLFGHSAGAGSVSAHSLSPHSRDLFARAIQMSGSAVSNWMYGSRVAGETLRLAKAMGCPGNSSAQLKECLRQKDPVEMQKIQTEIGPTRKEPNPGLYQARFDGDFFPEEVPLLVKEARPKPTLISFTKLESSAFTLVTNPPDGSNSNLFGTALQWSKLDTFDYTSGELARLVRDHVATGERFREAAPAVAREILEYLRDGANRQEASKYSRALFQARQFAQLCSDLLFAMPPLMEAKLKAAEGWPVYMFHSTYANEAAFPEAIKIREPYHAYDLDYIFHNPKMPFQFNKQDLKIQAFMKEAVRNFIKSGNPSTTRASTKIKWPRVAGDGPDFQHVKVVAPKPVVQSGMPEEQAHLAFWRQLAKKYPQYDLLFETPRNERWMSAVDDVVVAH